PFPLGVCGRQIARGRPNRYALSQPDLSIRIRRASRRGRRGVFDRATGVGWVDALIPHPNGNFNWIFRFSRPRTPTPTRTRSSSFSRSNSMYGNVYRFAVYAY